MPFFCLIGESVFSSVSRSGRAPARLQKIYPPLQMGRVRYSTSVCRYLFRLTAPSLR